MALPAHHTGFSAVWRKCFAVTMNIVLMGALLWGQGVIFGDVERFLAHWPFVAIMVVTTLHSTAEIIARAIPIEKQKRVATSKEPVWSVAMGLVGGTLIFFVEPYTVGMNKDIRILGGRSVEVLGLLFAVIGSIISVWSVYLLQEGFTKNLEVKEKQTLVTWGPFHYIRHPRYSGMYLYLAGIPLVYRSVIGVLGFLLCAAWVLERIPREEQMLMEGLGLQYRVYQKRTKKLIPFVY